MSNPRGTVQLGCPGRQRAAVEGGEVADLFVDMEGVLKPCREGAAMPAAADRLLLVLEEWPLDCVAPVGVPREAEACGIVLWRAAADQQRGVKQFGCSAWAPWSVCDL